MTDNVPYVAATVPTLGESQSMLATVKPLAEAVAEAAEPLTQQVRDELQQIRTRVTESVAAAPTEFASMEQAFEHLAARIKLIEQHLNLDVKTQWAKAWDAMKGFL